MNFNNARIGTAYALISSLSVSHDAVDVVWAAKQNLLMADKELTSVAADKAQEVENDD